MTMIKVIATAILSVTLSMLSFAQNTTTASTAGTTDSAQSEWAHKQPPKNEQHQKQSQSQSQSQSASASSSSSSSASGNGDGSNNSSTNVRVPASTAYAPAALPTVPCFRPYSAGGQGNTFGFSIGGGKIDENCAKLEVARSFASHGSDTAYCMVMVTTKYAKQAGVTMEMCMRTTPTYPVPVAAPAPVSSTPPQVIVPAPEVTVNIPAPIINVPAPVVQPVQPAPDQCAHSAKAAVHHKAKPCPTTVTLPPNSGTIEK